MTQFLHAAADEAQNLHSIPLFQIPVIEVLAIQDFQIQLHCHALGLDGKFTQQISNAGISQAIPLFAVHLNLNRLRHRHLS